MSLIALLDPDGPADGVAGLWLELIGQLHPALVHFPVALLVVAAALELVNTIGGVLGREDGEYPSSAARTCLTLAALGGAAAAFSGWTLSERMVISARIADAVEWHRWSGVGAAGLAIAALACAFLARDGERVGARRLYRLLLMVGAGVVSWAGHQGGVLVHGEDALGRPIEALLEHYRGGGVTTDARPASSPRDAAAETGTPETGTPETGTAELETAALDPTEALAREARALLAARCVECHGAVRSENGVRLDTREAILDDFLAFAGDPDGSLVVERVELPPDDEEAMPPPDEGPPLSEDERRLLRRWIAIDLPWPADGAPARE
jgi:uncharacterized membrane protein/mono/diheme cytochrome c family protein